MSRNRFGCVSNEGAHSPVGLTPLVDDEEAFLLRKKRTNNQRTASLPILDHFLTAVMNFCQGYSHCDMDCAEPTVTLCIRHDCASDMTRMTFGLCASDVI